MFLFGRLLYLIKKQNIIMLKKTFVENTICKVY